MNKFEAIIRKYLEIFAGQEMYFTNDTRNLELYAKTPENSRKEDVKTKVSALNDSDIRSLGLEDEMINHIVALNIDNRLKRNDLDVVEDIAKLTTRGINHRLLHFASVYCNFHKPDVFPIYSEQYLNFYKQYIVAYHLTLDAEELKTYEGFSTALADLTHRLGLTGKMNYLHLRKFAWLYADSILNESKQ